MEFEEISSLQDDAPSTDAQQPQNGITHQISSASSFFDMVASDVPATLLSKQISHRNECDVNSFNQSAQSCAESMVSTPLQLREPSRSCNGSSQPQANDEAGAKIQSVEELIELFKNVPQKRIVINGKAYDIDITDQNPVGQCATSCSTLKNVAPQMSMASDKTTDSQSEGNLANATPPMLTPNLPPLPLQAPSCTLPSFTGIPTSFNLGSIQGQLLPMGSQMSMNPSSGLILPMLTPPLPPSDLACISSAPLPAFNPMNFNFSMIQQNLQPLSGKPQLTLPVACLTPSAPDSCHSLRPSERQIPESTSSEESNPNSASCPILKKSISDMTDMINQKLIIDDSQIKGLQGKKDSNSSNTQQSFIGLRKKNEELEKIHSVQEKEILHLKKMLNEMSDFVIQHFSQKSITNQIRDQSILEFLSKAQMANAKVHLAFLFSSPLVKKGVSGNSIVMQQIDHHKEFSGMYEGLNKTNMKINYLKVQATAEKLVDTLNQGPIAIHFSGHGIKENTTQINVTRSGGISGYLVFEDKAGQAQLLPDTVLKNILNSQGVKPEFVFVASCHSQFAGNIFHQAGAKHVICIQQNQTISDEASICFSQTFYKALYNQNRTVCQAFDIAKSALASHPDKQIQNEASKFLMLKSREEEESENDFDVTKVNTLMVGYNSTKPAKKQHICRIFGPFNEGKVTNAAETSMPMFRIETSKIEDFIGRTTEMHVIIQCITEKRVVNIMGIPGIGKTTLVKAVAHFLDERQHFRDGIIILSLRNLDQVGMILTRLDLVIKKKQKDEGTPSQNTGDEKIVLEKILSFLSDKEILLIMDNAETPSKKDPKNFSDLIKNILDNCPSVRFLFTSRYNIGSFENNAEQVIELKELQMKFAVELLKKKASRKIDDQEIEELLKIRPDKVLHSNPLRQKEEQTGLESHHMFEILKGHPHAISLAAPLLQNKKLKELYELLNSDEIMNWLENQGIKDDPMGSLKVSMDISIKQLSDTEPQAIKLFWLIGLLPGGCTKEELDQLWGEGWHTLVEKLLRSSLLVKKSVADENIYQLFPFMNQYAATNMNTEEKVVMHKKITKHYLQVCKVLLREHLDKKISKLVQIETNIWGCIYRMKDKQTMQVLDDDSDNARPRSPKLSTTISHRVSTPMSNLQRHSNGEALTTSLSNQSESGMGIEISSNTHSKSRLSNLKSEKDSRKGAKSAMDTKKYNQVVSSNDDDDSSDAFPKSQGGTQGRPQALESDSLSQQNFSDSNFNDKYDSILSQRIDIGINKTRSKSERGSKLMRKSAIKQLEEVKELQPPPLLANKMGSQSESDSNQDTDNNQEEAQKNSLIQISYSQPQSAFDNNMLFFNQNSEDQTMFQNHPEDQSFSQSMIEPQSQLPLTTRKSSMEGQSQRFDSLFPPANQQFQSLNSSFNVGNHTSANYQSTPYQFQQLAPIRLLGQNASQSRLDQSFMIEEPLGLQNQLAVRQRQYQQELDIVSNFSGHSLISQHQQQHFQQNDLFDVLSNDGTSLMQQLDRLNLSQNSAAGLSFMTQGGGAGQMLLDQSMSYGPSTTSFMNLSANSQLRQNNKRTKFDQVPYTEVAEPIQEESMTSLEDEAEVCMSPGNKGTQKRFMESQITKPEENFRSSQIQDTINRGIDIEDVEIAIEENKSEESSESSERSNEVEDHMQENKFDHAGLVGVDESLDLNRSIADEDMQNNKLTEMEDDEAINTLSEKPEGHKYSSLKKGEQQRPQKRVNFNDPPNAPMKEQNTQALENRIGYLGKGSKLQPPTVFNKQNNLSNFTSVSPNHVTHAMEQQCHDKQQARMSEDGALVIYYITNLLVMAKYEDSLKVIDQCQEKFEHDRICTANIKKLQAYAIQQQFQHSRTAKTSYKEIKTLFEESLQIFTNMKNVLGQAVCHWAIGYLYYSHKDHFESAKKMSEMNLFNTTKKKFEEAARCYNEMKHYAGESVCHRFLSNLKNKMKESYIEHVRKQKELMTLENQLQKEGKSNFVMINGSLDGIEASLYLEVVGSPLDTSLLHKPATRSALRPNNSIGAANSKNTKRKEPSNNENYQLNIMIKPTPKNYEDKKESSVTSSLQNMKQKYSGPSSVTTTQSISVKAHIDKETLKEQTKKSQVSKREQKLATESSNSGKKIGRREPVIQEQNEHSDKKEQQIGKKLAIPKLNFNDMASDSELEITSNNGRISQVQDAPLSQRRKLEFNQKGKEIQESKNKKKENDQFDEKMKKPEVQRRRSILKVPTSSQNGKEHQCKLKDLQDITVQEVDDVQEGELDQQHHAKPRFVTQSYQVTEEEEESEEEDIFERISKQPKEESKLDLSQSKCDENNSELKPHKASSQSTQQTKIQNKKLQVQGATTHQEEKPQWKSAMRQSQPNISTTSNKPRGQKKIADKEHSPKANGPLQISRGMPQQEQIVQSTPRVRADSTIIQPQSDQTQRFKVTQTTTYEIECPQGLALPNVSISPSIQINHAQAPALNSGSQQ